MKVNILIRIRPLVLVKQWTIGYLKANDSDYLLDYRVKEVEISADHFEFILGA